MLVWFCEEESQGLGKIPSVSSATGSCSTSTASSPTEQEHISTSRYCVESMQASGPEIFPIETHAHCNTPHGIVDWRNTLSTVPTQGKRWPLVCWSSQQAAEVQHINFQVLCGIECRPLDGNFRLIVSHLCETSYFTLQYSSWTSGHYWRNTVSLCHNGHWQAAILW